MFQLQKGFLLFFILIPNFFLGQEITQIEFDGLKRIKESYILRSITTNVGDTLNEQKLQKEMRFFRRMPGINSANYSFESGVLTYNFEESITILPDFDLKFADDLTTWRLGFQEFNLFGQGIQLKTAYQNNGKGSFFVATEIPFLWKRFGLKTSYQLIQSDEPFFVPNLGRLIYELNHQNIEGQIIWNPEYRHKIEIGGGYIEEDYTRITNDFNEIMPPEFLDYTKITIKASHEFDNRDWNYFLTKGINTRIQYFKVIDPVNKNPYDEVVATLKHYKLIGKKGNLATRLILGFATNSDSPLAPFVLDSHINIRGVGDRTYRGTGTAIWNIEYRYSLFNKVNFGGQVVGFMDTGATRMPGSNLNEFVSRDFSRVHLGGGLRLIYKKAFNSVFRIDYGVGIDPNKNHGLVFGLGQYF